MSLIIKSPLAEAFLGFVREEIPYRKMKKPIDTNTALPLPLIKGGETYEYDNSLFICNLIVLHDNWQRVSTIKNFLRILLRTLWFRISTMIGRVFELFVVLYRYVGIDTFDCLAILESIVLDEAFAWRFEIQSLAMAWSKQVGLDCNATMNVIFVQ